jgi:osmotically-inducible protein OsmY
MGVVLIVIRWAAARTISRDPMFTAYAIQANPPIHVIVENGKVTLKGVVATPDGKASRRNQGAH